MQSRVAFRLGTIPVRVHLSFLLVTVFLAAGSLGDVRGLLCWILVVFVSVMIHELGHALVGRQFGLAPEIDLQGMGGLTSWGEGSGRKAIGPWRSIAISLAG